MIRFDRLREQGRIAELILEMGKRIERVDDESGEIVELLYHEKLRISLAIKIELRGQEACIHRPRIECLLGWMRDELRF